MNISERDKAGAGGWSIWTILFLVLLAVGWFLIVGITVHATRTLGFSGSMTTPSADMAHPWRAQLIVDFLMHEALVAIWILFRTRSRIAGIVLALLAVNGALFTLPYVFVLTILAKGDMRKVLLGWRRGETASGSLR